MSSTSPTLLRCTPASIGRLRHTGRWTSSSPRRGDAPRALPPDPPEVFREIIEVNFFGTLYPVQAVVPSMVERRTGSLVAISSGAALLGLFGFSAYSPAKYAVRGLFESLRDELRPHGVHVPASTPDVDTRCSPPRTRSSRRRPPRSPARSNRSRPARWPARWSRGDRPGPLRDLPRPRHGPARDRGAGAVPLLRRMVDDVVDSIQRQG